MNNGINSVIAIVVNSIESHKVINELNTAQYTDIVLLSGVGYRVELIEGNTLRLDVGYSHFVKVIIPSEVSVIVDPSGIRLTLSSNNKKLIGDTMYKIVRVRPRNPYTGAGIVIMSKKDSLRKLKSTKSDKAK